MINYCLTRDVAHPVYECIGTDQYLPVEVRESSKQNPFNPAKADIFACGIMLFRLAFGEMPFSKATKDDHYYRHIFKGDMVGFLMAHPSTRTLYLNDQLDMDMVKIILSCLQPNPDKRPSVSQLRLHSFVADTPD
jgi:serine/threonine protein kinase